MFLSAGLGMNYGPNAPAAGQRSRSRNVYVNPSSYRAFMKTGAWPDRTMFVLEIRGSQVEGSINRSGYFQTGVRAIEANVKDSRLPGGGLLQFGNKTAAVRRCHRAPPATRATRRTPPWSTPSCVLSGVDGRGEAHGHGQGGLQGRAGDQVTLANC
jgi:hypothetical protein